MSTNPANVKRSIQVLQEEEDSFDCDVPSLDEISNVKAAILSYAAGKCSLNDVNQAIDQTLNSNASADLNPLSDTEIMDISVKYHNSRYASVENYNFSDFLLNSTTKKDAASILENRRLAAKRLNALDVDPMVIKLVKILIEDGQGTQLKQTCTDYLDIMKRFRGEVEGFITSAQELDEETFGQIKNAIESANPGKKITLERLVDVGLGSGFIVKAGVQRFDFSMATVVHQGRSAVGTI